MGGSVGGCVGTAVSAGTEVGSAASVTEGRVGAAVSSGIVTPRLKTKTRPISATSKTARMTRKIFMMIL